MLENKPNINPAWFTLPYEEMYQSEVAPILVVPHHNSRKKFRKHVKATLSNWKRLYPQWTKLLHPIVYRKVRLK